MAVAVSSSETVYSAPRQVLYSPPPKEPWRVVPAIAPFGRTEPTSADVGPLPDRLLLGVDVTTSAAVGAAVGMFAGAFLALQANAFSREFAASAAVIGAVLGAVGGHLIGTALQPSHAEEVRRLREAIQQHGNLSRQEIAAVVGVDRRSLSAWTRGETVPSVTNLSRLRTLQAATSRLAEIGVTDFAAALGDGETTGRFTVAIRAGNVSRAVEAVVGDNEGIPAVQNAPVLSAEQWSALVRLADQALSTGAVIPESEAEPDDEGIDAGTRPLRIQLGPATSGINRRARGRPPVE